ncbi:hypothetical protein ACMA1D_27820 [Streptomyces sp. 796.1]|uniref:hypothetical protein n=1 Tax=Streptomyces sp. 796.1 TaxID=3163029 RepID=UPI0039C967E5
MAGPEADTPGARARALAVLRVRGAAQAVALLPTAVAVLLLVGGSTGHIGGAGAGWRTARWVAVGLAALTLLVAAAVTVAIARARPALSPTVPIPRASAPDLYRLVHDLADELGVPAPSAIALTPDCDSWLEDRTHSARRARASARRRAAAGAIGRRTSRFGRLRRGARRPAEPAGEAQTPATHAPARSAPEPPPGAAPPPDATVNAAHGAPAGLARGAAHAPWCDPAPDPVPGPGPAADRAPARPDDLERATSTAPVLVIGSPFLWWMRVAELRALLAPVVAGTGPAAHPDIAAARRFVRGLDAAVALAVRADHPPHDAYADLDADPYPAADPYGDAHAGPRPGPERGDGPDDERTTGPWQAPAPDPVLLTDARDPQAYAPEPYGPDPYAPAPYAGGVYGPVAPGVDQDSAAAAARTPGRAPAGRVPAAVAAPAHSARSAGVRAPYEVGAAPADPAPEAPAHLRRPAPAHPGPVAYAPERTGATTTRTAPPATTAGAAPGSTVGAPHARPDGPPPPATPAGRYGSGPLDPFDPPGALDTLDSAHQPGAEAAGAGPFAAADASTTAPPTPAPGPAPRRGVRAPLAAVGRAVRRPWYAFVGWVARLLLRACRDHAAEMERGVAAAAAQRAQHVDYGLRIVAQEQVGLAYAGWDRLLTRVALPAWRMGRWPARLDAGVVAALTELSRRDRLAEGFASRLGERPACDLLEEPGAIDEATSLLAARLFHGGPATPSPAWSPVDWEQYPEEVVDRKWRQEAARLHAALGTLPHPPTHRPHPAQPTGQAPATAPPAAPSPAALRAGQATTPPAGAQPCASTDRSHATAPPAAPSPATPPAGQATTPQDSAPATPPPAADATPAPPPVPQHPQPTAQPTAATEPAPTGSTPTEPAPTRPVPAAPTPPEAHAPGPAASGPAGPAAAASTAGVTTADPAASGSAALGPAGPAAPDAVTPQPTTSDPTSSVPTTSDSTTSGPEADALSPAAAPTPGPDAGFGPDLGVEPTLDRMFAELAVPGGADADPAAIADRLAARLTTELAREEAEQRRSAASAGAHGPAAAVPGVGAGGEPWLDGLAPLFPLQPPRTGRELLADHVTAMVCCAAMDTAGAAPGLDWLDGPSLLIDGERRTDLAPHVLSLVEDGDPEPLRTWLNDVGARPDKPIRLV